jgi:hypothetical protein
MSSNAKRLWVINLTTNTILYNSLVAHGRNTGNEFATSFQIQLNQVVWILCYRRNIQWKTRKSLRLDGLEKN